MSVGSRLGRAIVFVASLVLGSPISIARSQEPFAGTNQVAFTIEGMPDAGTLEVLDKLIQEPISLIIADIQRFGFSSRYLTLEPPRTDGSGAECRPGLDPGCFRQSSIAEIDVRDCTPMASCSFPMDLRQTICDAVSGSCFDRYLIGPSEAVFLYNLDSVSRLQSVLGPDVTGLQISAPPPVRPFQVDPDLLPGTVVGQASEGECSAAGYGWPFDPARVAEVIRFNEDVLETAGYPEPDRTGILVIDNGLGTGVLEHPDMSRLLFADRHEALAGFGALDKPADLEACFDPDNTPSTVRFGIIPSSEGDIICTTIYPDQLIAPRLPPSGPIAGYVPDHGGIVAVLAAGGPALITELPELERHIDVGMARIVLESLLPTGRTLRSDISDLADALQHVNSTDFPVLNFSLTLPDEASNAWLGAMEPLFEGQHLIVVAAGNEGTLIDPNDSGFPASLPREGRGERLLIVGGLERAADGSIVMWTEPSNGGSNYSEKVVDIAAPAIGALSLDMQGELACLAGTSVAAPQVSFVGAMLYSLGYWNPVEVRRRIMATADELPELAGKVRDGRALNVAHALDVYVDLVWREGQTDPERVLILNATGWPTGVNLQACATDDSNESLAGDRGFVNTRDLVLWQRRLTDSGEASGEIWRRLDGGGAITSPGDTCSIGPGTLDLLNLATGEVDLDVPLSTLERIVPSRFRVGGAVMDVLEIDGPQNPSP